MRFVDLNRLDERETGRWRDALALEPLIAEPESTTSALTIISCALAPLVIALVAWSTDPFFGVARGGSVLGVHTVSLSLTYGSALAVLAFAVLAVVRVVRVRRARLRCGRFLHRWGYAEVEPSSIRVILARDLDVEHASGLGSSGVDALLWGMIHLRSGTWRTSFRVLDPNLDSLRSALDMSSPGPISGESYRDAAALSGTERPARSRWRPALRMLAAALLVGALGAIAAYVLVVPRQVIRFAEDAWPADARHWRAASRELPSDVLLTRRAAEALSRRDDEIAITALRTPHQYYIREWLWETMRDHAGERVALDERSIHFDDRCRISSEDAREIDRYVQEHATGPVRTIAGLEWPDSTARARRALLRILPPDYVHWSPSAWHPGEAGWVVRCRFAPVGLIEENGWTRAAMRVRFTLGRGEGGAVEAFVLMAEWEEHPHSGSLSGSTTRARYEPWASETADRISAGLLEELFRGSPSPPPERTLRAGP